MIDRGDAADAWNDEVDEIIEEVREVRRRLWERFDDDPVRINEDVAA
jgi:hypothetical protein